MNLFNIHHILKQWDFISFTVAIILFGMSIISWGIIVRKYFLLKEIIPLNIELKNFWHAKNFNEAINQLSKHSINPYVLLALRTQNAIEEHQNPKHSSELKQKMTLDEWVDQNIETELEVITSKLQSGSLFLASTGSTAPFIGLFGTVWGILHALVRIGETGTASLDQVAGPIGESLIMTAFGLAVAIPAVLAYNAFSKVNNQILGQLRRFSQELRTYFSHH